MLVNLSMLKQRPNPSWRSSNEPAPNFVRPSSGKCALMDKLTLAHATGALMQHLSPLRPYMDDPTVQEIKVNCGSDVWIEQQGRPSFKATSVVITDLQVTAAINTLANINSKNKVLTPILDCRLPGLRIAAANTPIAIRGSALCIRKHAGSNMVLDDYVNRGIFDVLPASMAKEMQYASEKPSYEEIRRGGRGLAAFLQWMVRAKRNIIVTGSTSSGKTTMTNALLAEIPAHERVISIEDTAELIINLLDYVSFESNESLGVSIRDLVRLALRFAPKRIIVGEIRGAEAYDLMAALNTGHQGGIVTFHADSAFQGLPRLEGMVRQSDEGRNWPLADLRQQIAGTFHYIIHAAHEYGTRGPIEIRELLGAENGIYQTRLVYSKIQKEESCYA
jgi:pilus assembly protein CpaF